MQLGCRWIKIVNNVKNKGESEDFSRTKELKNCAMRDALAQLKTKWRCLVAHLLPGLTAGIFAKSGGNLSASKVSTCNEIKLSKGTPKFTAPLERSTTIATP